MAQRLAAILFVLTAFAAYYIGLASFSATAAGLSPINFHWLPIFSNIYFAAPTVFLLAGISAIWPNRESAAPRWITALMVFVVLMHVFIHRGLGWKPFLETAGTLVSIVFVLGLLARHASTIAGMGIVLYAVVLSQDSIVRLQFYWAFGGSYLRLLATVSPPILVTASLVVAISLHFKTQQPHPKS
jgi:hypothetical protein